MRARLALTVAFVVASGCGGRPGPTLALAEAGTADGGSGPCPEVLCGAGQACRAGECIRRSQCQAPLDLCPDSWGGHSCVDLFTDPLHCGECLAGCPDVCYGWCQTARDCPSGRTVCGGACVNLATDPLHCGDCNRHCGTETPYCVAGSCSRSCPSDLDVCDGTCVNLRSDVANCGECGVQCIFVCDQGICW